ncbi:MAG: hypothetical protein J0H01_30860 [Rhizobiales bacterium]|nr:hypothetical protein [Hyphomicrobiales bacterium]
MNFFLGVIAGTPLWVWAILALIVVLGGRAMRPSTVAPLRVAILPAVSTVIALSILAFSSRLAVAAPAFACGAAAGAVIGAFWANRLAIEPRPDQGVIAMPGTAFWLVFGLGFFLTRYVLTVYLVLHRELSGQFPWTALPYGLNGIAMGMALGWLGAILWRYRRSVRVA